MECTLGRFAGDTKRGETAATPEGKAAFQRYDVGWRAGPTET